MQDARLTSNSASSSGAGSNARGGVWSSTATGPGDGLHLGHATIDDNRATSGPGTAAGGGLYLDSGTVTITASSGIRHNTPDNCAPANSVAGC